MVVSLFVNPNVLKDLKWPQGRFMVDRNLKKIVYENVDLKDFRKSANENRKIFEN